MLVRTGVEAIDPDERKAYGFDFSEYLDEGDAIEGAATWTVTLLSGTHADPSEIKDGGETVVNGIVSLFFKNAKAGATYLIECKVTTGNASVLELSGKLRCTGS